MVSLFIFSLFSSTKLENRRAEHVLGWTGTSGQREVLRKEGRRVNMVQNCLHMYINAKMIPVETVLGIGVEKDKGVQWRGRIQV
jgi:hypothetical protein